MIDIQFQKNLNGSSGKMLLDIDLKIVKGAFVSLYGPSGAGKTSILRMIAGLLAPDQGKLKVGGETWYDSAVKVSLSPQKRDVGMVFQDFALFPNLTVRGNLEYAKNKQSDGAIVGELIDLMDLGDLQDSQTTMLSGGQKQRVALARSIVQKPSVLLLDEPLSALDPSMRSKLQDYILKAHKVYDLTTIMVSHDVAEIFKMSDEVIMLDQGCVTKRGKPREVFANNEVSGKFQFTGEIVEIQHQGFLYIISILIGNDFVKVIGEKEEVKDLKVGERVMVASKAFNPIIKKLHV